MSVYEIAMRITLANSVSAVLGTIAAQMLRMQGLQGKLNAGFASMGLGFKGVLALAAGGGMFDGLNKLADLGDDVIDQQNQMVRLGIKQNEIARLTADYWKSVAKAVPTSTLVEYLQTVKELRAVVGSTAEAEKFAPAALKFDVLLSNVLGKEMHGSLYQLLRAGEMKGIATQPGQLQDLIQQAYKYIAAFGGKLTPQMIQRLAVRGGTAWMNANLKNPSVRWQSSRRKWANLAAAARARARASCFTSCNSFSWVPIRSANNRRRSSRISAFSIRRRFSKRALVAVGFSSCLVR